jgi:hypothetical protein
VISETVTIPLVVGSSTTAGLPAGVTDALPSSASAGIPIASVFEWRTANQAVRTSTQGIRTSQKFTGGGGAVTAPIPS